ncbi:MAG TPA: hypothetical protein VFL94_08275 [Actinomycetales bacterium]|nr:hypothetical protein [Actinomycetales bacterium]
MAWSRGSGELDGDELARLTAAHLVLVPVDTDPELVDRMVRYRSEHARLLETGRGWLARSSAITGPYPLNPHDTAVLHVPAHWQLAYAVHSPVERDPAAFQDVGDPQLRAWWMRAFPTGKPYREEGEAVDLALALARHVGGAFRPAGGTVTIVPDPHRGVDLTVWSVVPLGPEPMLLVLQNALPGAQLQGAAASDWRVRPLTTDTEPWTVDLADPATLDVAEALSDERRDEVEAVSRQHDTYALAHDEGLDGYAITGRDDVLLEAMAEEAVPSWVEQRLGAEPTDLVVTFTVRWLPANVTLQEAEELSPILRRERDHARERVRAVTRAVVEAVSGVITDNDGFEVDRYSL